MDNNEEDIKIRRRTKNDQYSKNKRDLYNSNNLENDRSFDDNFEYREGRERHNVPRRKKAGILFYINLLVVIATLGYIFIKGIFPLSYRLVILAITLIVELLLFKRLKNVNKRSNIIPNIFLLLIIAASIAFLYLSIRVDSSLKIMNKDNVEKLAPTEKGYAFNVYISGIDTYGDLDTSSRSDVNIIATVNTKTGKVLLTTISRDAYLPIAGDGNNEYDKLTHAGNYGIQASVDTLANVFDINISYFARINFDSLIKIVDVLGGIDVENRQAFNSRISDYYFEKGKIHLDGDQALAFVRERYNLEDGDRDRGRNQELVIAAMIKKMMSPSVLIRFEEVLSVLEDSINTNMPSSKAIDIMNSQLLKFGKIDVESQEVDGEGEYGLPSYAMPDYDLFMFVPYEESMREVRANMQKTME